MSFITWKEFEKTDLGADKIIKAGKIHEAINPVNRLWVNCGYKLGIKKSGTQVTALYRPEELIGKQDICMANFTLKQIGPSVSEILVTGFPDADRNVVIVATGKAGSTNAKLF